MELSDGHQGAGPGARAPTEQPQAICLWMQRACASAGEPHFWDELDTLLQSILERAARDTQATGAVLSITVADGDEPRIFNCGLPWDTSGGDRAATATIVSEAIVSGRDYGHLAVKPAAGAAVSRPARDRLRAYACEAAAALDVSIALDRAARTRAHEESLAGRLQAKTALLEAAVDRYQKLVMSFPGIVYVMELSDDGGAPKPVYVSPQVESLVGLSVQEWESDPEALMRIVHPDDRAIIIDNVAAFDHGEPAAPFRMMAGDGSAVWMQPQAINFEQDGRRYRQGILLDITQARLDEAERGRLEAELRLAQKLEAVGELAAGVAHEINTPIQFVGDTMRFLDEAFVDLIRLLDAYEGLRDSIESGAVGLELLGQVREAIEDADLDYLRARVPAACRRARDGIDRVATIVRAMRRFAHPSSGAFAPVDINEALRSTLVVATNVYKYVADVELDLGELPSVICDGGEMNQVFLNLIVNAAHAIEDAVGDSGGRGTITIRTASDSDGVVVTVCDTGCGIPSDVAPRVFDPFYTTKDVGRGSGQGLALAHAIVVDRHGGSISFETQEGAGTTFAVRLPTVPHQLDGEGIGATPSAIEPGGGSMLRAVNATAARSSTRSPPQAARSARRTA